MSESQGDISDDPYGVFATRLWRGAGRWRAGESKADLVKRGDYLVNGMLTCGNCHTPKGPIGDIMDKAFSGGLSWDEPPFKVTVPNITPDKETGIGGWTDAQIKTGVAQGRAAERHAARHGYADDFYEIMSRARRRGRRRLSAYAQADQEQGAGTDLQDAASAPRFAGGEEPSPKR